MTPELKALLESKQDLLQQRKRLLYPAHRRIKEPGCQKIPRWKISR